MDPKEIAAAILADRNREHDDDADGDDGSELAAGNIIAAIEGKKSKDLAEAMREFYRLCTAD